MPDEFTIAQIHDAVRVLREAEVPAFKGYYNATVHPRTAQLALRLYKRSLYRGGRKARRAKRLLDRYPVLAAIGKTLFDAGRR